MKQEFFLLAPDEGGSPGTAAVPDAAPEAPPTTTPEPAPTTPDPSAPSTSAAVPAAAPAVPSWLDNLKKHNLPVGANEDETIQNLRRMADERQAFESLRPLVPHVQQFLSQAQQFQEWQRQQQAQKPAAATGDPWYKSHFSPPEFDQTWLRYMQTGPDGKKQWSADAPPEVVAKFQAYQVFREQQAERFMSNPFEYFQPLEKRLEDRAREIAKETFDQHMRQEQDRSGSHSFVQQNSGWLYEQETGADGKPTGPKQQMAFDPNTGRQYMAPVLSPWGQKFQQYAEKVYEGQKTRGYHDEAEIQRQAYDMVQRDFALWENQQLRQRLEGGATPPVDPQAAANKKFLDRANPVTPTAGGRNGGPPPAEKMTTGRNLARIMMDAMKSGGVTDQTLSN